MKLSTLGELKKAIGKLMNADAKDDEFPMEIYYSRGIDFPSYKINIELMEQDFFVDSKGVKWKKVTNDDES